MMFYPSQGLYMPNRGRRQQRFAFGTFMPASSLNQPDWRKPLHRGVLAGSVATVVIATGLLMLTTNDKPFGDKVSLLGIIAVSVGVLTLIFALRQFRQARKRFTTISGSVQMESIAASGVTAVVLDDEDGNTAATIVVETWDTDQPVPDEEIRNPGDLAPPAYIDISQSCSSVCPSFMSHEEHNEAPPTYEESCGNPLSYPSSENTSLSRSQPGSRRGSSLLDMSRRSSSLGPGSGVGEVSEQEGQSGRDGVRRLSSYGGLLCPASSGALMAQATVQRHRQISPPKPLPPLVGLNGENMPDPGTSQFSEMQCSQMAGSMSDSTALDSLSPSSPRPPISPLYNERLTVTAPPTPLPPGLTRKTEEGDVDHAWSRRSFSSIPSYTCLLSKSGEVSAQVFDTSSIIQGLMPYLAQKEVTSVTSPNKEKHRAETSAEPVAGSTTTLTQVHSLAPPLTPPYATVDTLSSQLTAIPTRSHSLTSVTLLGQRQGVPYCSHNSPTVLSLSQSHVHKPATIQGSASTSGQLPGQLHPAQSKHPAQPQRAKSVDNSSMLSSDCTLVLSFSSSNVRSSSNGQLSPLPPHRKVSCSTGFANSHPVNSDFTGANDQICYEPVTVCQKTEVDDSGESLLPATVSSELEVSERDSLCSGLSPTALRKLEIQETL